MKLLSEVIFELIKRVMTNEFDEYSLTKMNLKNYLRMCE
jgi:hypothetical protein